ncbi:D-alanyl-D-alanine carboxypeptidase family protein [Halothermothrix orenii]|uniref:serine-type D-Ala-D-Ala carboxypeptidase n=1 Tax=Halothermothrix orenii (strain H 168 / OCM 544 / DSM 9562) TaxID=373903 RepID=B8D009_HALOH|nr:D-alanyl-D-alanine carboxypeptidase family protein [Halothermothrix orenii]ACL70861.1 peptidase S11 D-alanyl-D-alanine carboxypeptidase 1 [Halothermothrix orenii H 168]
MKKIATTVAIIIVSLILMVNNARAGGFDIGVDAAILIDAESGQVLYEKNADKKLPPASITKIMTLLLTMEEVDKGNISLDSMVTVSQLAESMGGSQIYLAADTRLKLRDLLKAVTIASANDACVAVAEAVAGTEENFVRWMNKRARELGMKNTHFSNTTGLPTDGEHYTTARDVAIMARELIKHPQVLKWASIWVDYIDLPNGRKAMLTNTNRLINDYPGMDGLKTGHTDAAGYCLAATARRNGMRLISVIMKGETEREREEATARLLDYGFNSFEKYIVLKKGHKVHNIEVPNGTRTSTVAETANDLKVVVKKGEKDLLTKKVVINEPVEAPVKKGDVLGKIQVLYKDQVLSQVKLLATEDIEKAGFLTRLWRSIARWFQELISNIF